MFDEKKSHATVPLTDEIENTIFRVWDAIKIINIVLF